MIDVPDLLGGGSSAQSQVPPNGSIEKSRGTSDNIAAALFAAPMTNTESNDNYEVNVLNGQQQRGGWGSSLVGGMAGFVHSARDAVTSISVAENVSNAASTLSTNIGSVNLQPFHSLTKSISNNITGKSTLPDKTTASQVLMFRQLLHTKCRPGLRLSRGYEGTAAQRAVLHMPWWERGIEQSKKMVISYDNLITRLWLSGAIMPYEKGGYAANASSFSDLSSSLQQTGNDPASGLTDTLINDRGLPPVPHQYWIDRLGFQQDDPVTDFRSGGVLSLAMLVHIVESCPAVHARFVPKQTLGNNDAASPLSNMMDPEGMSLEQIITDDASVLPFGITCINVTDMLAKFLMFSKSVDKMDALLSAKPFWKMFIDPNAMLMLQEVSLDLLCDVCVEIGRERRLARFSDNGTKKGEKSFGRLDGKVTVFDFSEIMDRTEKRVGDEVLGAGPQNVAELRAIARRVKSKYLMRIQLKEKHLGKRSIAVKEQPSLLSSLPNKESMKNVTNAVMGVTGVGGFATMWKTSNPTSSEKVAQSHDSKREIAPSQESQTIQGEEVEIQFIDQTKTQHLQSCGTAIETKDLSVSSGGFDLLGGDLTNETKDASALSVTFDLLGGDFSPVSLGDIDHSDQELLDAMDSKLDPLAAFAIDDDDFRI